MEYLVTVYSPKHNSLHQESFCSNNSTTAITRSLPNTFEYMQRRYGDDIELVSVVQTQAEKN